MVSTCPPIPKSSSPFNNSLVTVTKAPITIGIIVIFMFHFISIQGNEKKMEHEGWGTYPSLSLSDNKSHQVSRILNILADINNAVVWMVSTRPLISKSSSPCTDPLVTVPRAPITIGITVTFIVIISLIWEF